ncbi:Ribosomal RNA-processing protein 8 [Halotydeus destructor]|nr:Ribosomal RNA-processing protein 8 [Halotydeus destructor]
MATFRSGERNKLARFWSREKQAVSGEVGEESAVATAVKRKQVPELSKKQQQFADKRSRLTDACVNRLAYSQFRSINEYLYSHTSAEAERYMDDSTFEKYHSAYDELAEKWPVKPISQVIKWVEDLYPKRGKDKVLVDMGCGPKPLISEHFTEATVHSFDLVSNDANITKADIANVPLEKRTCDCVVFCLSLMGTNVKDYIMEANRILKKGGSLIIAEVMSRFEEEKVKSFTKKLEKGYGFKLQKEKHLPPNNFFILLHYEREKNAKKLRIHPELTLKPCIYKPR